MSNFYQVEIFTDQFEYASACSVDSSQTIDLDYMARNTFSLTVFPVKVQKGYLVHITRDGQLVADGIVSDVQPNEKLIDVTIRPLQALFDVEVFYTPVSDAITWIATNIGEQLINNTDTYQNRPIDLTYTVGSSLPLTGYNFNSTINILNVIENALKSYGVVTDCWLDLVNKRVKVNVYQQTAQATLEAGLDNVLERSITIGDSYGSKNKLIIRRTRTIDGVSENLGDYSYYLHTDGSINDSDTDRIFPVFYGLEELDSNTDETLKEWKVKALSKAKEELTPDKYDNEIILSYKSDDKIARPMELEIGTFTTILYEGKEYSSILGGRRIEDNVITLTFGNVRTELTKKLSFQELSQGTIAQIMNQVQPQIAELYQISGGGGGIKFPVGSVVITATNTNPSSTYGGSWVLIDKEFKQGPRQKFTPELETANCSDFDLYIYRSGHVLHFLVRATTKVAVGENRTLLCTMPLTEIGITGLEDTMRFTQLSDYGDALIDWTLTGTGEIWFEDAWKLGTNLTHSVPAQKLDWYDFEITFRADKMLDAACDKFYWKRLS